MDANSSMQHTPKKEEGGRAVVKGKGKVRCGGRVRWEGKVKGTKGD